MLGHLRSDAAAALGVDPKTWMWRERDVFAPCVSQYPAIIAYLGYEPWPAPSTLGQRLLVERRRRGLSMVQIAELAGVDDGTWRRWERDKWKLRPQSAVELSRLLGCSVEAEFPQSVRTRLDAGRAVRR